MSSFHLLALTSADPMHASISAFVASFEGQDGAYPYLLNKRWNPGDQIFYSGPFWDHQEIAAAVESLITSRWLSAGDTVTRFEKSFSKDFGFNHSVMVNSGSSANLVMIAALKEFFGWDSESEIIVSVCGFPTTLNPVLQNNLNPILVDIDFDDLNWSADEIERNITTKTKALFCSPVLGNPGNYDRVLELVRSHNLILISDNCDSLGSKWRGKYLTEYSTSASCSFYPAHHLCTVEGGMVSSNEAKIVSIARSYAWWGRDCYCEGAQNALPNGVCGKRFGRWLEGYEHDIDHKYVFSRQGYNLKPLDLQGALGLVQLGKADHIHQRRRANKSKIQLIFERIPGCRVVNEHPDAEVSWFGVPIVYTHKRRLVAFLEQHKIQTRNYFAGNLLRHPAYKGLADPAHYVNADRVLDEVFFLGCSPVITDAMIDYIDEVVSLFIKSSSR
jgi:CDP-6-deoxy-D-xylo-4-hexulose-3-dehydrase